MRVGDRLAKDIVASFWLAWVATGSVGAADVETPRPPASTALPGEDELRSAIDAGFVSWSSRWALDRFVTGSVRVGGTYRRGDIYELSGSVDVVRSGMQRSIFFSATFTRRADAYRLSLLCYKEAPSARPDCMQPAETSSPDALPAQRPFLAAGASLVSLRPRS